MKTDEMLKGSVIVTWEFASNGHNRKYLGIRFGKENETKATIDKKHISTNVKEDVLVSAADIEGTPADFQRKRMLDELNDNEWKWLKEETDTFEKDVDELLKHS